MTFIHKYSFEEKTKILLEYQTGVHGFCELCRIYGMAEQALKDWIRLYETFGLQGLQTGNSTSYYPKEVKEAAVQDYLNGHLPVKEILKKYKIRSNTQLRKWVLKYNGHKTDGSRAGWSWNFSGDETDLPETAMSDQRIQNRRELYLYYWDSETEE